VRTDQDLDMLLPGADLKLIERAESQLFELFWGKSMGELRKINHAEMFRFADQFRELMYDMPFQLPNNLLMLGRTVAILSGMCTGLDANFNLWAQLAPYASTLISQEAGSNWRTWLDEIGNVVKGLISLPGQAGRLMSQVERGELTVQVPALTRQMTSVEKAINRLSMSLILAALLIAGILLLINNRGLLANAFFIAAGIIFLWIIFTGGRSNRFHP
jgi:predicted unusual protein kinase regulating ubiquinone biosynthesis (AarF/ABC1/UbiB family)